MISSGTKSVLIVALSSFLIVGYIWLDEMDLLDDIAILKPKPAPAKTPVAPEPPEPPHPHHHDWRDWGDTT